MRVPESSSVWPAHALANPRWLEFGMKRWDRSGWHDPMAALRQIAHGWRWCDYLYTLVRRYEPWLAVETGVYYGQSSAAILSAMNRNRRGTLVSIDSPEARRFVNSDGRLEGASAKPINTGCLVPRQLRWMWDLRLGDAKELLPKAVADGVDFFLHDSEHSLAHMTFEYETVWPALSPGGILVSDDTEWSSAWPEFLHRHAGEYVSLADGPGYVRAVRKVSL